MAEHPYLLSWCRTVLRGMEDHQARAEVMIASKSAGGVVDGAMEEIYENRRLREFQAVEGRIVAYVNRFLSNLGSIVHPERQLLISIQVRHLPLTVKRYRKRRWSCRSERCPHSSTRWSSGTFSDGPSTARSSAAGWNGCTAM
jgi:hypothetical protein